MKRLKHSGEKVANCPVCLTQAEIDRYPWQTVYERLGQDPGYHRKHSQAIRRQAKVQAMRDLGLTKVRGALDGTYWE